VEGQIASLEEKKAAAEVAHLRAQNELKDAQDLVNATKKHSAVLQDTLTVSEVDIDFDTVIGCIVSSLLACEMCAADPLRLQYFSFTYNFVRSF